MSLPPGRAGPLDRVGVVDDDDLLETCHRVVAAVPAALAGLADWRPDGDRPGQYALDLTADRAVLDILDRAGLGVLSEESGLHRPGSELVAVVDPVDGSTNASRGIPWYATSIAVLDAEGPRVAVVANLASGVRYQAVRGRGAVRGGGAFAEGVPLAPTGCSSLAGAVVGISGYPARHLGWAQFRAFGAAALDLCAVAEGSLDAFAVCGRAHLAPWDYLGALLVCGEAGVAVADRDGLDLVTVDFEARRAVLAAATPDLLTALTDATRAADGPI